MITGGGLWRSGRVQVKKYSGREAPGSYVGPKA